MEQRETDLLRIKDLLKRKIALSQASTKLRADVNNRVLCDYLWTLSGDLDSALKAASVSQDVIISLENEVFRELFDR